MKMMISYLLICLVHTDIWVTNQLSDISARFDQQVVDNSAF